MDFAGLVGGACRLVAGIPGFVCPLSNPRDEAESALTCVLTYLLSPFGDGLDLCANAMVDAAVCRLTTGKFLLVRLRGPPPEALVACRALRSALCTKLLTSSSDMSLGEPCCSLWIAKVRFDSEETVVLAFSMVLGPFADFDVI